MLLRFCVATGGYQEDMVCSHLCFFLQPHSDRNLVGMVRERWSPLNSSDQLDKPLQSHLMEERQTESLPDRRNLQWRHTNERSIPLMYIISKNTLLLIIYIFTRQTGSRNRREARLGTVKAGDAALTLGIIHEASLITVNKQLLMLLCFQTNANQN